MLDLVAREESSVAAAPVKNGARSHCEQGEHADRVDGREKRRRSNDTPSEGCEDSLGRREEAERRRLQAEVDRRGEQLEAAAACEARARQEAEALKERISQLLRCAESRQCDAELEDLRSCQLLHAQEQKALKEELKDLRSSRLLHAQEKKALEEELAALRLERASSSQERTSLLRAAEEMRASRACHEAHLAAQESELGQLRASHMCLEQECSALQEKVAARDKALSDVGNAIGGEELAKRDLAALADVAASIIAEFCSGGDGESGSVLACASDRPSQPKTATPFELSLAWSKWQRKMTDLSQHCEELQRSLEQASGREQKTQEELRRLRADLAACQARCADQEADLRRAKSESASLASRNATLRDALGAAGAAPPPQAPSARRADEDAELRRCSEEPAAPEAPGDEADAAKVLHLLQRPFDDPPEAEQGADADALAACDLERAQAVKQLKCLQRGVKKHVLDYKEGVAALLGWHVEMREESDSSRWHLSSKLHTQEGQSLIFQKKRGSGRRIEFELMSTPWAQQLQEDQQAISYITFYRSIPGFLAHITDDLLAKRTLGA